MIDINHLEKHAAKAKKFYPRINFLRQYIMGGFSPLNNIPLDTGLRKTRPLSFFKKIENLKSMLIGEK